jgi:hypothetical protein
MREGRWVDRRNKVLLNEASRIARGAGSAAEHVLKRRKRAKPAGHFDPDSPEDGWKMKTRRRPPAHGKETTREDKDDERQMEDEDKIGQSAVDHEARSAEVGSSVLLAA